MVRYGASLPVDMCRSKTSLLKFPNGRLLRHLDEEDDGKGERGEKRNAPTRARASLVLYFENLLETKKDNPYADFLRRSPTNVCVGGYERGYFRQSKPSLLHSLF